MSTKAAGRASKKPTKSKEKMPSGFANKTGFGSVGTKCRLCGGAMKNGSCTKCGGRA